MGVRRNKPKWPLLIAAVLFADAPARAMVAPASLSDLVRRSDFIGVVRVDRITGRIPLVRRRHATAAFVTLRDASLGGLGWQQKTGDLAPRPRRANRSHHRPATNASAAVAKAAGSSTGSEQASWVHMYTDGTPG